MSVEIIAEVAQGYEGNVKLAELLAGGAIATGADAVKFQLVFADELCVPNYPYYDLFQSLEMPKEEWVKLIKKVHDANKRFYFDVYGEKSLGWARELKADGVKISTTDFFNISLREQALKLFDRVYFSTGGVSVEDIDELVESCENKGSITLMHGFQAEPTLVEDNHLKRISTLQQRYSGVKIGFMDHALGISDEAFYLPLVALGQGVSCIEKHISLDPLLEVEDFVSALTPSRFDQFVKIIRTMEPSLGSEKLELTEKELLYKSRAGKVVVASSNLAAGTKVELKHLEFKRVSTERNPDYLSKYSLVTGKTLTSDLAKDQPFLAGQLS